jgi:uncharacterized membrane protein YphA (DoxX/SURF4 family)
MKAIALLSRILLGCVFIFSGFVKGIDPLGSTYKFVDYFTAFGWSSMIPAAFVFSLILIAAEFVLGMTLVLGVRMKETACGTLLFMLIMTPLTLYLAIYEPVSDCGCFGDALVISNWQTFYKNIVLLLLAVIVFAYRKKYIPVYRSAAEWGWVTGFTVVIMGISVYCYRHLPVLDFRPYSVGANIPEGMAIPEGKPVNEYKTTFYYEKEGVVQEFSEQNYPWDDTTWVWVDTKQELIKAGYEPPIHDFSITTIDGFDITDDVLADESYIMLLVAHRLDKSNKQALKDAAKLADFCENNGYRFYGLTSSPENEIQSLGLPYEFCFTDEVTLKTVIRSNPGIVLLQKGTILGKWHYHDMPDAESLSPNLLSYSLKEQLAKAEDRLICVFFFLFVLIAFIFYRYGKKRGNRRSY